MTNLPTRSDVSTTQDALAAVYQMAIEACRKKHVEAAPQQAAPDDVKGSRNDHAKASISDK